MQGFSQNPIMALLANLRRPQIYDGNPFQMAGQQQAEAQVDAVGAPPPAPAQAPAPPSPQRDRPGTPARRPSLWRALSSGLVDGGIAAGLGREEARVAALDAQDVARARQQELAALADRLQMPDQERLVFLSDPEAWAKAQASALETRVLGHSDTLHTPGEADYQPGVTPYDQRSLDEAKAKADADRARMAAADAERARANAAREGLQGQRESRVAGNAAARRRPGAPSSRTPAAPAANPWDKYR